MLVLSRKTGEQIVIGDDIRLTVVAVCGDRVRLGFTAPAEILIRRTELRGPLDPSRGPDSRPLSSPGS
jgi:carbon storage regulator